MVTELYTDVAQPDSTKVVNPTLKSLGLGDDVVIPQLDRAQVELLEVKVEEVSVESLFTPVPLVRRLIEGGIYDVQELARRQREEITKRAKEAKTAKQRQPEIRLERISNQGTVVFKFSSPLSFPQGTLDRIKE